MRRTVAACLSAFCLSACGGGGPLRPLPLENLDEATAKAFCDLYVRCGHLPDEASCGAVMPLDVDQLQASVRAGRIQYDGAAAAECLADFGGSDCTVSATTSGSRCDDAFKGTVATGAACLASGECVSRDCNMASCDATAACCQGTCNAGVNVVALGGECAGPGTNCGDDAYCATGPSSMVGTCTALPGKGQACNENGGCARGLWCSPAAPGGQAVCTPLPNRGQACDPLTLPCDSQLDFCDADTLKCVPRRTLGQTCASNSCIGYALCDPATKVCVSKPGVGEPCLGGQCLVLLQCDANTCVAPTRHPVCP